MKTFWSALTLVATGALMPFKIYADEYEVVSYKNCNPTYSNQPIKIGMTISDPSLLQANWSEGSGSKYIKITSRQNGKDHIITQPQTANKAKSDESFMNWLENSITGQKKCSTRAPENELAGGLSENLSQTFYLLISESQSRETALEFASNLEAGSKLHCTYYLNGRKYSFDAPLVNNKFKFYYDLFPSISANNDRLILRLNINYIAPDGKIFPLTNSMNVILIPE